MTEWLLDSDPSIRWQVRRELTDDPADVVALERALVATEGRGADLLAAQGADGRWGVVDSPAWVAWTGGWRDTLYTLLLLREFGLDPQSPEARRAVELVRDHVTWGAEFGDSPFFEGEVEPCINGMTLTVGGYFGEASGALLERLLGEQLDDGGWNCEAPPSIRSSFHSTICVLEGLRAYELSRGSTARVTEARMRGQEYLLERRLFRSRTTGDVIDPEWTEFSFPTRWHYDVLRGLEYLRDAGVRDDRVLEAVDLVASKQDADGRWARDGELYGRLRVDLDGGRGEPSRWNTLRALRVLRWFRGGA